MLKLHSLSWSQTVKHTHTLLHTCQPQLKSFSLTKTPAWIRKTIIFPTKRNLVSSHFSVIFNILKLLVSFFPSGMNHESNKSASLGMISTATRTTATVSPLSPLTNGNAAAQSANSGFAAALRKLAKQAEDPRGERWSGPPVSQNRP